MAAALGADLFLGASAGPELSDPQEAFAAAFAVQDRHASALLAAPGVVGIAVGIGPLGGPILQVYLRGAEAAAALPTSLDGFPLVATVTGPFWALGQEPAAPGSSDSVDPRARFPRPVPIGVSTGRSGVSAGTIGARATDGAAVYALSNNHVFAAANGGRIGDNVIQPGVADGGRDPDHTIGVLADFEPILFCAGLTCPENTMDAALALTSEEDLGSATPEDGYGRPRSSPAQGSLGQEVQKYGRTTGLTRGVVTGIRATVNVSYRTGSARFAGQLVVSGTNFSRGGDSGSLVVTAGSRESEGRPVGLLFAGSQVATLVNPIGPILERFGVTIDGS